MLWGKRLIGDTAAARASESREVLERKLTSGYGQIS